MSARAEQARENRALLEKLLQKNGAGRSIPKRLSTYEAPLSFAQQRLWFFEQLMPGTAVYNILMPLPLPMNVEPEPLRDAVNEIVARHEVLRTTFKSIDGQPVQVIAPKLRIEMPVTDLSGLSDEDREAETARLRAESLTPYDLSTGPLIRVRLVRLGPADNVLLLSMHHIVSDAWSVRIFYQELTDLYEAFAAGRSSPLAPLHVQYADFAVWQRDWLRGEILDRQLGFWKEQLDGIVPIELPCDHPRPASTSFHGAYVTLSFGSSLLARLRALSARHECTLFMTLLAAFQVFLSRHTGQEDVVVGTPVANRNRADIEKLIGFFINSLVLRTDLAGNPTFSEVLLQVREIALAAYAHQDIPFETLVEHLQPQRDFTRNPIFQVLFQLQSVRTATQENHSGSGGELHNALFDLNLYMVESPDALQGRLEYNAALFDERTIRRMAARLEVLLDAIADDPDRRIGGLSILTTPERQQLLTDWNPAPQEMPDIPAIHQWFEQQAARTPHALAVSAAGSVITYSELNRQSDAIARRLRELEIGQGDRVAICLERGIEIVAALLGALKAGAAYVPIDPEYPANRVRFVLEDCGARAIVTKEGITAMPAAAQPGPNDTAYIIYTSGSTGIPKGVVVPHRALVYSTWARLNYYREPVERYLLLSPFAFDSSVAGIFWTLSSGGCLEIPSRDEIADIPELAFAIERKKITHLLAVPSLYARLLDWFEVSALSLRVAIVAGEVCSQSLASYHFERMPRVSLYNEYGPTEATVWSTVYRCRPDESYAPPIGRPIPNARAYVVDRNGEPVPIGVAGELWIGGPGVAAGYWQRSELTAERFIPDPFSKDGSRLYRTGDRTKYLPDGNIVFLGRMDNQVKMRGYRIELGEVEAALLAHPAVAECSVFDWKYEDDTRLAAWIVPAGERVSNEQLMSFLRQRLPEYMVPSSVAWVPELPRTPNGKLDRAVLAANPERFDAEEYVAPRSPVEKTVARLYAEVLGVPEPGVHSDFFRLGGHSLLATRLLSRVNSTFRIDLPLPLLFHASTVAELALEIERAVVEEISGVKEEHV